jgi:hypothetical protein
MSNNKRKAADVISPCLIKKTCDESTECVRKSVKSVKSVKFDDNLNVRTTIVYFLIDDEDRPIFDKAGYEKTITTNSDGPDIIAKDNTVDLLKLYLNTNDAFEQKNARREVAAEVAAALRAQNIILNKIEESELCDGTKSAIVTVTKTDTNKHIRIILDVVAGITVAGLVAIVANNLGAFGGNIKTKRKTRKTKRKTRKTKRKTRKTKRRRK